MHQSHAQVPVRDGQTAEQIAASGTVDPAGSPVRMSVAALRQIAVRGAAYIASARLIIQLFNWVVTIVTARLLRPYDYGVLAAAVLFTNLADVLAEAGVGRALVQKPEVSENDLAGAFTVSLSISVLMYLAMFAGAGMAARALQSPELVAVLRVIGLVLLLVPFRSVPLALLERRLQLKRVATIGLATAFVQGCLVLTLALCGWGYWALILGYMIATIIQVPVVAWQASWLPRIGWPEGRSNPLVLFGIHYTGARLCWFLYRNADYAVVGRLLGPVALGYYSFAFMLVSIPVEKIATTCNQVAFPVFCRMSDDRDRVRTWFLRLLTLLGLVATPALVGLALVANDAIHLVLGPKWIPAVLPFQIMSLAGVLMVLGSSVDVLYNAVGRPDINFRFTAISAVVYPVLFYVCGRQGGVVGVALVWAICYPIMVLVQIGSTRSITGISVRNLIHSQLPIWASVLFMALVVLAVRQVFHAEMVAVRLGMAILAGVLGYVGAIRILAWKSVMGNVRLLWQELRHRDVNPGAA